MRVIPARHTIEVAHLRDPNVEPRVHIPIGASTPDARSHDGKTVCGIPLLLDEQWIPWPDTDPAPTCTECLNGRVGQHDEPLFEGYCLPAEVSA